MCSRGERGTFGIFHFENSTYVYLLYKWGDFERSFDKLGSVCIDKYAVRGLMSAIDNGSEKTDSKPVGSILGIDPATFSDF